MALRPGGSRGSGRERQRESECRRAAGAALDGDAAPVGLHEALRDVEAETDAAHAAGFADSAHLTRTCRDMFGLPPSVMSRHVSWDIDEESSRIIQA